jgi:hypothetical protein
MQMDNLQSNNLLKVVNMLGVKLECGHFNERLQRFGKNLRIWLQS